MKTMRMGAFSYLVALAAALMLQTVESGATTASWTNTAGGAYSWNVNGNWDVGAYPNAQDDVAYLTNILTAAETVNLNQTIALGTLVLGAAGNFHPGFTIAGNGGTLDFKIGSGSALLALCGGFGGSFCTNAAPTVLDSNLIVSNAVPNAGAYQQLVLSGNIRENGGSRSLTYKTASWASFIVRGSNTYSGGTMLGLGNDSAMLELDNVNALGTGPVTTPSGSGRINFNLPASATFSQDMNLNSGNGWTMENSSTNPVTLNGSLAGGGPTYFFLQGVGVDGGFVFGGSNASSSRLYINNTSLTILTNSAINNWNLVMLSDGGYTGKCYLANGVACTRNFYHHMWGNYTSNVPVYLGMSQAGTASVSGTLELDPRNTNSEYGVCDFNLDTPAGATLTLSGVIQNTSTYQTNRIIKIGAGTVVMSANNTYPGPTTISTGTLQVGNGGTSGTLGAGSVTNNGTLVFNRSDTGYVVSNVIVGTGSLLQSGAGTVTIIGANTYGGPTIVNSGTLQVGNGGTSGALGTGSVTNNGALVFNRSDTGYVVSSVIAGTGTLRQMGAGTLTLSGVNTYSGGTAFSNGTLSISADNNLGDVSGGLTFGGGALEATSSFALSGTRAIVLNAGGGTFNVDPLSTLTDGIAMTGVGALTKTGLGTLVLGGANAYSGGTFVQNGTLQLNAAGAFPGNALTVNGGVFDQNGYAIAVTTLNGSGGTITNAGLAVTSGSFGGVIAGGGALTVSNSFTLSGSNTYSGGTVLALTWDGYALTVANANALGTGAVTNLNSSTTSARINFNLPTPATFTQNMYLPSGNGYTLYNASTNPVTLNGALSGGGGAYFWLQGVAGNGGYVFGGNNTSGSRLLPDNTSVTILTNTAINSFNMVILTDTTSHTGKVYLANGVATSRNFYHHVYGNLTTNTPVYLGMSQAGAASISGTVDLTGRNSVTDTAISDFYLDTPAGATLTLSGIISSSSTYTTNNLFKIGAGTVVMSANNTYGGPTTISNGTLQVGNGGTSGKLGPGSVTNNGALVFNRSDTSYVVSNSIAGTGSLTQSGTGTVTLVGTNSYSGLDARICGRVPAWVTSQVYDKA